MVTDRNSTDPLASLQGVTLLDRYQLCRPLGQGGMGIVFEALDLRTGLRRAVKLQKLPLDRPGLHVPLRRRFRREALLGRCAQHPGLVTVLDGGELADGTAFLVMELLAGACLFDVLTAAAPLPWPEAVELAAQAADALAALHAAGIVHRDIKPENLHLLPDGTLKVLDLGVLRVEGGLPVDDGDDTDIRTGSNEQLGTLAFMAPEQIQDSRAADGRSDLYALGLVLFEALTGEQPFRGLAWPQLAQRKFSRTPLPPLRSVVPEAPPALEALLLRCVGDPEDRPATAALLRDELLALLPEEPGAPRERLLQRLRAILPSLGSETEAALATAVATPLVEGGGRASSLAGDAWPWTGGGAEAAQGTAVRGAGRGGRGRLLLVLLLGAVLGGAGWRAVVMFIASAERGQARPAPIASSTGGAVGMAPAPTPERAAVLVSPSSAALPRPAPPVRKPAPRVSRAAAGRAKEPSAEATLFIAVHPFAEVFIDGARRSEGTPHRYRLPAGRHEVRLLNGAHGFSETRVFELAAGASERFVLDWSKP